MNRRHRPVIKQPCRRCGKAIQWARATRFCSLECRTAFNRKPTVKMNDEARFWRSVKKTETCWLWLRRPTPPRWYGKFAVIQNGVRKCFYAHRYAWKLAHGEIAEEMTIDHMCGNKLCVNPEHMQLMARDEHVRLEIKRGKYLPYGNKRLSGQDGRRELSDLSTDPVQGI